MLVALISTSQMSHSHESLKVFFASFMRFRLNVNFQIRRVRVDLTHLASYLFLLLVLSPSKIEVSFTVFPIVLLLSKSHNLVLVHFYLTVRKK
jgi:hypothetical protein